MSKSFQRVKKALFLSTLLEFFFHLISLIGWFLQKHLSKFQCEFSIDIDVFKVLLIDCFTSLNKHFMKKVPNKSTKFQKKILF